MKYSSTKLMPKIIADMYHVFLNNFFQSMKSTSLSIEKPHLIKHKNEKVILFNTLKKIISGLNKGFRGLILMEEDYTMRSLVCHNTDHVISKTGCFLCNHKWNILEVTQEVYELFKILEDEAQAFKDRFSLINLFPELLHPEVQEMVSGNQGGVIKVFLKNFSVENEEEPNEKAVLLWIHLIEQNYEEERA